MEDGEERDFDCLLGMSGGVDSSYMLHLAVKELGWDYNNEERIFNLGA